MSLPAHRYLSFAKQGPLFRRLGARPPPAEEWKRHGDALAQQLLPKAAEGGMAAPVDPLAHPQTAARIFHLYLPIYFWCKSIVDGRDAAAANASAVGIGLSAVQGCGKTTLVNLLTARFAADGLVCAAVSFDDFYLCGADQDALAAGHSGNPILQVRGNAGTHDIELGSETLKKLLCREVGVSIPRYDKSSRGGRGDRAPVAEWTRLDRAPDVVLLEGWMAGFKPVPEVDIAAQKMIVNKVSGINSANDEKGGEDATAGAAPPPSDFERGLVDVNRMLASYNVWHDLMSAWIVVSIDDLNHVYRWRLEAEQAMAARGKPGMSDDQVQDFVSRYMPAYRAYLPGLYAAAKEGGQGVGSRPTLLVHVDGNRQIVTE
eukprot:g4368.t1